MTRVRITATHEFDVAHEGLEFWMDKDNEPEHFETLMMAHEMGADGTDEHHQVTTFKVEEVDKNLVELFQYDGSMESAKALCRWTNDGQSVHIEDPITSYVYTDPDVVDDVTMWDEVAFTYVAVRKRDIVVRVGKDAYHVIPPRDAKTDEEANG